MHHPAMAGSIFDSSAVARLAGGEATLAERAADMLRRSILTGELPPGLKLRIRELTETYGIGATPLREALSRLVSVGLVDAIGRRGFRVAPMSREDFEDVLRARTLVDTEALRLSIEKGGDAWEAGVVGALHMLYKFTRRAGANFRDGIDEYDLVHKAFHTSLLAACGSPRLLALHSVLYDQNYRYRRIIMRDVGRPSIVDEEHQELADLALARKTETACEKLSRHLAIPHRLAYGSEKEAHGDAGRRGAARAARLRRHAPQRSHAR